MKIRISLDIMAVMNTLIASLVLFSGGVGEPSPEQAIAEFSPDAAWTYSISPTLVTVKTNQLFQVQGTITDADTWTKPGSLGQSAQYISVPNSNTGWSILLDSGNLIQINDANGNPVPNPAITPLGAGSVRSTYTIRAKGVSVQSVYVDTYSARDYGGTFRPPSPYHIWDGDGATQTCYVTVTPE